MKKILTNFMALMTAMFISVTVPGQEAAIPFDVHSTVLGGMIRRVGARLYDDRLCRWTSRDPMSEKYYGFSPYAYCAGDPVNLVNQEGDDNLC